MDNSPSFENIAQHIAPGCQLRHTRTLAGGLSAQMVAIEVETEGDKTQRFVVRWLKDDGGKRPFSSPHPLEIQYKLLQQLKKTSIPTPAPIHYDSTRKNFPSPYLVTEFLPGEMTFTHANLHSAITQLGTRLAQIHAIDCRKHDFSFLQTKQEACVELNRKTTAQFNDEMEESCIRDLLQTVGTIPQQNSSVLLHGDYWPGNVLWQGGELTAVIDWEDAQLGDPLIDLAISRLDIVWIFGIEAMQQFTQQYQSLIDINYDKLPYWDLCAALRLIRLAGDNLAEWVSFFAPYDRRDITVQSLLENYRFFIAQAFERM